MQGIGSTRAVLKVLREADHPLFLWEIARSTGFKAQTCSTVLLRLVSQRYTGLVRSGLPRHYTYELKKWSLPT